MIEIEVGLKLNEKLIMPSFTGIITRGLFLDYISNQFPELAESLHESNKFRPYVIQGLYSKSKLKRSQRNEFYVPKDHYLHFKVFLLKENIKEKLVTSLFSNNATFKIFNVKTTITELNYQTLEWNEFKNTSFSFPSSFNLSFYTPTYLTQMDGKSPVLWPEPIAVLLNICRFWNEFCPETMKIDIYNLFEKLASIFSIYRYNLRTIRVYIKKSTPITSFVGYVAYKPKKLTPAEHSELKDSLNMVNLLLKFGEYVGVGGNRTAGMGRYNLRVHSLISNNDSISYANEAKRNDEKDKQYNEKKITTKEERK